jgi:hypothetical protein
VVKYRQLEHKLIVLRESRMISGIYAGGVVSLTCFAIFLSFPGPFTLALVLLISPLAGGFLAARLGGGRAAFLLALTSSIMFAVLIAIYFHELPWEYAHNFWGGVTVFTIFFTICNFVLICAAGAVVTQVVGQNILRKQERGKEVPKPVKAAYLRGTLPPSLNTLKAAIAELEKTEQNLINDLLIIRDKKGLEGISPDALQEKDESLQKQILEVVLEKERLIRKLQAKG